MKHDIERRGEIIADILQGKKKSKAEFAVEHGVAEITINRDLQWFRNNGIPLFSKNGKVVFVGDYSKDKLNHILSEYLSVKLNSKFYMDKIKTFSKTHPNIYFQNLVKITKAVSENKYLRIRYKRITDDAEIDYIVKPIQLRLSGYNWIMHGIKEGENLIKMFYLSRIKSIEILKKSFESAKSKDENGDKTRIKLKFSNSVKNQLVDKIWFDEFKLTENEDGDIILSTEHEINNSLAGWCVSWWDSIEILEPIELKNYISEMINYFGKKNL